ncbi:MAG: hypothetical protein K0U72_09720 [Gammaproteobacteria bacterium]|nr:hypothetical protein [Gammaproteobacteria bacterium]
MATDDVQNIRLAVRAALPTVIRDHLAFTDQLDEFLERAAAIADVLMGAGGGTGSSFIHELDASTVYTLCHGLYTDSKRMRVLSREWSDSRLAEFHQ